jgi:Zn-dependent peptidase ImmA (M78 family)/transcriptional regulator with XRE-family HTH domain
MINGYRVRQARELSRLTQAELADAIDVAQSTIAHIEGARFQPSDEIVKSIAAHLGFPVSFFTQDDPPNFPLGSLLFRAHSVNLPALEKAEAHRYGQLIYEISVKLSQRVRNKTPLRLPQLADEPTDPLTAAHVTRDVLGISPDAPIPHLVRAVEQIGVLVFALPTRLEGRDAFSLWTRFATLWATPEVTRPVVLLSSGVPGDRLRFSVAHELGHLVMHQAIHGTSHALEEEADTFAAELLMPQDAARARILPPVTLTSLAALKPVWGISVQALLLRAKELEIMTYRQYRYLWDRLRSYGWDQHEPVDIVQEKPRALRQMMEMAFGLPIDYQWLASELHVTPHFARSIVEAHATREEFTMRTTTPAGEVNKVIRLRGEDPGEDPGED